MRKPRNRFSLWNTGLIKFRKVVVPPLLRLGRPLILVRRWLRPHKLSLGRVESAGAGGQPPLAILCSGPSTNKNYFLRIAFDGFPHQTDLGEVRLREVFRPGFALEKNCPLVVVETTRSHFNWLKPDGCFFIPLWVSGGVRLPVAKEAINNNSVKNDLRKIKRFGLEYSVTRDEARFLDFYHHLHVPYTKKAYGDEAFFDRLAEKRRLCESYDLLLVHKKSRPGYDIAGVMLVYEPAGPRVWSLGVREDGEDHVREGVIAALYHFAFEHLAKKHSWVSLGGNRSFLHDGLLIFKTRLSQTLLESSWNGFALKIAALTPAAKNFLLKTPFIFQAGGGLHSAVFVDEELSLEKIRRLHRHYLHPGLTRLVIHTFRDEENFPSATLPSPLAACVTIRRASELLGKGSVRSIDTNPEAG